jgi:hypothetical protein
MHPIHMVQQIVIGPKAYRGEGTQTPHHQPPQNMNKSHYLIDDREKNGAADFEGDLIKFSSMQSQDRKRVLKYLMEKGKSIKFN